MAEAIVAYAKEKEVAFEKAENLTATAGQGVEADVAGKHILAGNLKMMQERGIQLGEWEAKAVELAEAGKTLCSLQKMKHFWALWHWQIP